MISDQVNLQSIREAQQRISSNVQVTPVLPSVYLSQLTGFEVFLKLENLNLSGSFKIRGATNAVLMESRENLKMGVAAASAGNHAQGVAQVAKQLGVSATIFMPERTPQVKVESTRALGATVVLGGAVFDDAFQAAQEYTKQHQSIFIHPYADPRVISGQGTAGLELAAQIHGLDAVIVPIGGGGLISGMACAMKSLNPKLQIIGVQVASYPSMQRHFAGDTYKKPTTFPTTIADGIAVKSVNPLNAELISRYVDDIVLVEEEETASAVMALIERNHLLSEGAGAVGVAALTRYQDNLRKKGIHRVAIVISGGNIDIGLVARISERGLIQSGRLCRLRITLSDRPGSLANLLKLVSNCGANISQVIHNRTFSNTSYADVEVELVIETSNMTHRQKVFDALAGAEFVATLAV